MYQVLEKMHRKKKNLTRFSPANTGLNPEFSDASLELESEEFSVNREDAQEVTE